jgi:hypothetical protein
LRRRRYLTNVLRSLNVCREGIDTLPTTLLPNRTIRMEYVPILKWRLRILCRFPVLLLCSIFFVLSDIGFRIENYTAQLLKILKLIFLPCFHMFGHPDDLFGSISQTAAYAYDVGLHG